VAKIQRDSRFPHILLVTGNDVPSFGDDKKNQVAVAAVVKILKNAQLSPVRPGTHHYWIIYGVGAAANAVPEFVPDFGDESVRPHPFYGVVSAKNPTTDMLLQIHMLLQEIGHRWLVKPDDMAFSIDGGSGTTKMDTHQWLSENAGIPFSRPLLDGRQDLHWGNCFRADGSPFDGQHWIDDWPLPGEWRLWKSEQFKGPTISPPNNLPPIDLTQAYNDLDLFVMGVKEPRQCYKKTHGRFFWMDPVLVSGLAFRLGLCVGYADDSQVMTFGYDGDYGKISLKERGNTTDPTNPHQGTVVKSQIATVTFANSPQHELDLRVVHRRKDWWFQARVSPNHASSQGSGMIPGLFDGLDVLGNRVSTVGTDFVTVAHWIDGRTPAFIGILASSDSSLFVEGSFHNLELLKGGKHVAHIFEALPAVLGDDPAALFTLEPPEGKLWQFSPTSTGRIVDILNNTLILHAPSDIPDEFIPRPP
jgi:hypothetical protein